jgi:hypothetical protein
MTGRPGIDGYLSEVAAVLPGPARARDDIIAELRSGLLDAADAYRAAGHSPDEAAAAATAEFGDPRQIAAGSTRSACRPWRGGTAGSPPPTRPTAPPSR